MIGMVAMRKLFLGLGVALAFGGAALANSSATTDAEKALCTERGGAVKGSGASAVCATPAQDAVCAKKNGAAYGFDYRTGGCGTRSAESGETSGGWQDVN